MTLTAYLLNLTLVGLVVLQIKGHRVTRTRLLVPVALTIVGAGQFLHAIPLQGGDAVLEGALALTGATLGTLAGYTTSIRRSGEGAVAKAGPTAAVLWVLGIGARVGFSLWVAHGGQTTVAAFSASAHITSGDAWVAGFILMAMAEVVARTAAIFVRTVRSGAVVPRGGLRDRVPAVA